MDEINSPMIADLHCHPTIPALNTQYDMWHYDPPTDDERSNMINTSKLFGDFTQSDYTSLYKAKARLVFHGYYPIEQGILIPSFPKDPQEKWTDAVLRFAANSIEAVVGRHRLFRFLSKTVYQMLPARYDEVTGFHHSYFADLLLEHQTFLAQQAQNTSSDILLAIENYAQLKQFLGINDQYEIAYDPAETTIKTGVIFSVEGGHSLGCGQLDTRLDADLGRELAMLNNLQDPATEQLRDTIFQHIQTLRELGPPGKPGAHAPFYITFCHHFWNQLCGQAMSLAGIMNRIADQTRGLGQGFTELGKLVVTELLRKVNSKRILIDVKHMGPAGRKWYYNYLLDIKSSTGETIPIIASHMGVTGNPSDTKPNDTDPRVMDTAYANDKGNLFNLWDINLSGDDILAIHGSGGLIGLNFDQRILSGVTMVDNLEAMSRDFKQSVTVIDDDGDEEEIPMPLHSILAYRAVWAQPLLENLLFIVKTVYDRNPPDKEYAWKMVCIGSDFDGFINAIDAYCHAEDFQVLAFILKEHLKNRALVDPLLGGMNLDEIVKGFMYKNALRFLEAHFV